MHRRQLDIANRAQRVRSKAHRHGGVRKIRDGAEEEFYLARWTGAGEVDIEGHLACRFDKAAVETGDGIPILRPLLDAMRLHEFAIALRGEASALDFVVGAVIVAEDVVPDPAAASRSPTPKFFAGVLSEVGYMDDAVVGLVVVDAEEIAVDIARKDSERAGIVLVPALIDAFPDRPALHDGEGIVGDGLAHGVEVLEVVRGRDCGVGPEEIEVIERRAR